MANSRDRPKKDYRPKYPDTVFEKVSFRTSDGFIIYGNLYPAEKNAIILLHQFKLDKSSYHQLCAQLQERGYTCLAIDLRGHGESVKQNTKVRTYNNFGDSDYVNMLKDVHAADEFLRAKKFRTEILIGASIGANTALNYAVQNPMIKKVVLLSPGINYKGIDTQECASKVDANVLLVASREDEYATASAEELEEKIFKSEFLQLVAAGHGTYMFGATNLENEIVDWIEGD